MVEIVWCSPHPTHYNSYLFEHINDIEYVSFTSVFFYEKLIEYPWGENMTGKYSCYYLNYKFGIDYSLIFSLLRNRDKKLFIASWNNLTMIILLSLSSLLRRPFILVSDTLPIKKRVGFKQFLRKIWLKWIWEKSTAFLVTGDIGVKNCIDLGVAKSKLINFPFATNIDYFTPLKNRNLYNQTKKEWIFISSGRLDIAHKGYDVAIKAFHKLKCNYPGLMFKYIIAGEGRDRGILEDMIAGHNLEQEVILKGWLEINELIDFYHSGDVFIHPSNFDPYPNAVLEALACGLPIIGSSLAGSVLDRVKDNINGFVFQAGDYEELFNRLQDIMFLPMDEYLSMCNNARAVAEKWDIGYHIDRLKRIIKI